MAVAPVIAPTQLTLRYQYDAAGVTRVATPDGLVTNGSPLMLVDAYMPLLAARMGPEQYDALCSFLLSAIAGVSEERRQRASETSLPFSSAGPNMVDILTTPAKSGAAAAASTAQTAESLLSPQSVYVTPGSTPARTPQSVRASPSPRTPQQQQQQQQQGKSSRLWALWI